MNKPGCIVMFEDLPESGEFEWTLEDITEDCWALKIDFLQFYAMQNGYGRYKIDVEEDGCDFSVYLHDWYSDNYDTLDEAREAVEIWLKDHSV